MSKSPFGSGRFWRSRPSEPAPPALPASMAALDVLRERLRQVDEDGFDAAHDDAHAAGELSFAAGNYLAAAAMSLRLGGRTGNAELFEGKPPFTGWSVVDWPWSLEWWKPGMPRRMLVKAAALILAEIERIDRAEARTRQGS